MSFTTCWGHVEELLAAGEQESEHTKPFFFPIASASGLHKPSTWSRPKVIMKFKKRSKSRMGMCPSDERSNYESIFS
ncbi:hypothetical protein Taro_046006 [Colocasia esculenta]|uniref:Uncharacterized protein n=1 Tax=Colocasia esculenta TaxID=4460 RepID=A0A843X5K1_COLES|nr:hypothetical protein [Colocasia esculenta]